MRLKEISEHARSYGFPEHHPPMHTFLGVPIIVRGRVFGRLYVTEKEGGKDFTKDDERIAMTLASQAGVAVENARLTLALQDMAVLEERDRIAKELHDGVIQSIYSVGLSLQGTMSLIERDVPTARKRIDGVIAELDNVVRDVRSYIFELKPKSVEEHGLEGAIGALVRDPEKVRKMTPRGSPLAVVAARPAPRAPPARRGLRDARERRMCTPLQLGMSP